MVSSRSGSTVCYVRNYCMKSWCSTGCFTVIHITCNLCLLSLKVNMICLSLLLFLPLSLILFCPSLLTEGKRLIRVLEYQIIITSSHKPLCSCISPFVRIRLYMSTPVLGRYVLPWNQKYPQTNLQRWLACCLVGLFIRYLLHLAGKAVTWKNLNTTRSSMNCVACHSKKNPHWWLICGQMSHKIYSLWSCHNKGHL